MKSEDKETHTFMFCSLFVAKTWFFFKIVFGQICAPTQFELSIKVLSKIQYALYKTPWKTYLFLQHQLSTLIIREDSIFDVTKITVFWGLHTTRIHRYFCFLHLLCSNIFSFTKDLASNHPVCREIARDRGRSNFEFCKYQRSPELTERTCHCIMQLELSNYIFGFLTICKPCLFWF